MTPSQLSCLHHAAFANERPWSSDELEAMLASKHVALFTQLHGFALARTVAGESELLTIAVDPNYQSRGMGRSLVQAWLMNASQEADVAFLEVAADNLGAIHLYQTEGFAEIARRKGYYARKNSDPVDAILMQRQLTKGQDANSTPQPSESG